MIVKDEQGNYTIETAEPDAILALAAEILESRINNSDVFCSPAETRKFLQLKLHHQLVLLHLLWKPQGHPLQELYFDHLYRPS